MGFYSGFSGVKYQEIIRKNRNQLTFSTSYSYCLQSKSNVELRIVFTNRTWPFAFCYFKYRSFISSQNGGGRAPCGRQTLPVPLRRRAACRGLGSMFWSLVQDHWLDNLTWEGQVIVPIGAIMATLANSNLYLSASYLLNFSEPGR